MPKCLNDPKRSFRGDEPSPKGLGWCAHAVTAGTVMAGLDGNKWNAKSNVKGTVSWRKIVARRTTKTPEPERSSVDAIRSQVKQAVEAYYNGSKPLMTDEAFDALQARLAAIAPNDALVTGVGVGVKGAAVKLPFPMMSLDKVKAGDGKLARWIVSHPAPFTVSDKLDGTSAMVVAQAGGKGGDGALLRMFRRGTGTHGADISHIIPFVVSAGARTKMLRRAREARGVSRGTCIAVRGELLVSERDAKRSGKYANARSHANALAMSGSPRTASERSAFTPLRFVAYELVSPRMNKDAQFATLASIGFDVVRNASMSASQVDEGKLVDVLASRRSKTTYAMDGLVVECSGVHILTSNRNPTHAVAFKDPGVAERVETTVTDVEWNLSGTGKLVPKVIFEPVNIGGVTIRRAAGHNARWIQNSGVGVGARIVVVRAGDVIPKIDSVVRAVEPARPSVAHVWDANRVHFTPTPRIPGPS